MNRILDWAEANMKPNLWALLLFAVLLRSGYQFHEIQKPTQWMGAIVVILLLALFGAVALRGFARSVASAVRRSSSAGFTLIEIAIVLVVVGLIASTALSFAGGVRDRNSLFATKVKMQEAERALLGFVIANGCLPCPANPTATTGIQDHPQGAAAACDAGASACNRNVGALPWVTLGLSEEEGADGWARRFTYAIPTLFHSTSACTPTQTLTRCNSTFPDVPDNNELVIEDLAGTVIAGGNAGAAATQNKNFAYVLLSHGQDGSFGRSAFTSALMADRYGQAAGAPGLGQHENSGDDATTPLQFATGTINTTGDTAYFDDVVVYRGSTALIISCGSGSCGNP
jgi:prepilin-type N-terminal cleavage/methylation domain-containing protein